MKVETMLYVLLFSLCVTAVSASQDLWGEYFPLKCPKDEFECSWYRNYFDALRDQRTKKIHDNNQFHLVLEDKLIWQCLYKADLSSNCTASYVELLSVDVVGNTNTGSNILLKCASNHRCSWLHGNGTVNTTLPRYEIVDHRNYNCSLRIKNVQKTDQGRWFCDNNVWLTVHDKENPPTNEEKPPTNEEKPPTNKEKPPTTFGNLTAEMGSSVILPCRGPNFNVTKARTTSVSSHSSHSYSKFDSICFWMHGYNAVFSHRQEDTPGYRILYYSSDYQQCDLIILNVKAEDHGDWQCIRPKNVRQQIHLTVPGNIDGAKPDVTAMKGATVFLPCRMRATNKLCLWVHNTTVILYSNYNPDTAGYEIVSDPEKGRCDLLIHSVQEEDQGEWYCRILGNSPLKLKLEVTMLP